MSTHNQISHIVDHVYRRRPIRVAAMKDNESVDTFMDQIRRRFAKGFLDILILRLVDATPTWGYDIMKKTQHAYNVKLRHGALYPMLNELEARGLVKSTRELEKGRARKVYQITEAGSQLLEAYYDFIKQNLPRRPRE